MVCLGEKTITKWDLCRKLTLFAYSAFGRIYVFLDLSSISSPAFVMCHKTEKLFHLVNSSEHFLSSSPVFDKSVFACFAVCVCH